MQDTLKPKFFPPKRDGARSLRSRDAHERELDGGDGIRQAERRRTQDPREVHEKQHAATEDEQGPLGRRKQGSDVVEARRRALRRSVN